MRVRFQGARTSTLTDSLSARPIGFIARRNNLKACRFFQLERWIGISFVSAGCSYLITLASQSISVFECTASQYCLSGRHRTCRLIHSHRCFVAFCACSLYYHTSTILHTNTADVIAQYYQHILCACESCDVRLKLVQNKPSHIPPSSLVEGCNGATCGCEQPNASTHAYHGR